MIGFWTRLSYAFRCFFAILSSAEIPPDIASALIKPAADATPTSRTAASTAAPRSKTVDTPAAESADRAVQMLGLLQRDGRLIDFLAEDVTPFPDAQLGAAVRSIHTSCRQVLERYVALGPVIDSDEDQPVTVPAGFDPAAIKLVGNAANHRFRVSAASRMAGEERYPTLAASGRRRTSYRGSRRGRDSVRKIPAASNHL